MSYAFAVVKSGDSIELESLHPSAIAHIPDGRFMINGHVPAEGTSRVATIGVTLVNPGPLGLQHIGSANASYAIPE